MCRYPVLDNMTLEVAIFRDFWITRWDTKELIYQSPVLMDWADLQRHQKHFSQIPPKFAKSTDLEYLINKQPVFVSTSGIITGSGKRVNWSEYRGYLLQSSYGNLTIEWREREVDVPPIRLRIMPEFGGTTIWDEYGVGACIESFLPESPWTEEIESELNHWCRKYEREIEPACLNYKFDWDSFHLEGLKITRKIKAKLGKNSTVFYDKAYEDPGAIHGFEIVVFQD